jgi:hypothetical protein
VNPNLRRAKRINKLQRIKSARGVEARRRLREEQARTDPGWQVTGTYIVQTSAAPDGKHMAIYAHHLRTWTKCGTHRAVTAALARLLKNQNETQMKDHP